MWVSEVGRDRSNRKSGLKKKNKWMKEEGKKKGGRETEHGKVTCIQLHLTQQFSQNLLPLFHSRVHFLIWCDADFYHQAVMSSADGRSDSIMELDSAFFYYHYFLFTSVLNSFSLRSNATEWRKMIVLLVIEWINHRV